MIAIDFTVLLGAIMLLVFGFLKVLADCKSEALRASKELFDEHYQQAEAFIKDSASPASLSKLLVTFSRAMNDEKFGRLIVDLLSEQAHFRSSDLDKNTLRLKGELDELGRYRPDLADIYVKAIVSGFLATAYRQAAREMSPLRVLREAQQAKKAKGTRRPDEIVPTALKAAYSFGIPQAA